MHLLLTTTHGDEIEEILDLEIPKNCQAVVNQTPHPTGRHEITFDAAQEIITEAGLDVSMMNVRCWLCP